MEHNDNPKEIVFNENGYKIIEESSSKTKKIKKPKKFKFIYFIIGLIMALVGIFNLIASLSITRANRIEAFLHPTLQSVDEVIDIKSYTAVEMYKRNKPMKEQISMMETKTFNVADVDILDINLSNATLIIQPTVSGLIELASNSHDLLSFEMDLEKSLRITENTSYHQDNESSDIELYLPNKKFKTIRIKTSYSNIVSFANLTADEIIIENTYMDTTLQGLKSSDITITNGNGNLYIEGEMISDNSIELDVSEESIVQVVKSKSIGITNNYGYFSANQIYTKDLILKSESGDITANELYATNVTLEANYGDFNCYQLMSDNLNVRSISGNLNLQNVTSANADVQIEFGDFNCYSQFQSDNLKVINKSGNINIQQLNSMNTDIEIDYGECVINLPHNVNVEFDVENKFGHFYNNIDYEMSRNEKIIDTIMFKFRSDFSDLIIGSYINEL